MVHCYLSGNPVHDRVIQAFYDGCDSEKKLLTLEQYEPSDIAVIFGIGKRYVPVSWPRGAVFRQQREKNLDVIVLETGYINRGDGEEHHYAAGFNGLNGRADFRNWDMPDDRAKLLNVTFKPYTSGDYILLVGQVPWDASVDHTGYAHSDWIAYTKVKLAKYSKRSVRFRPHPLGNMGKPDCSLDEDLAGAHAVVTFNSNTGVDATIAGKAVFADDHGSMVYGLAVKSLNELEDPFKWANENGPVLPNREKWLANLAYTQWTPAEFREGLAWRHLTDSSRLP